MTEKKIAINVDARVSGQTDIEKLGKGLQGVGQEAKEAGQQSAVGAQGVKKVGQESQSAASELKDLGAAAATAGDQAQDLANDVRGLGQDLDNTAAKAPELDAALKAVGKAVVGLFAFSKAKAFAQDTIALADAYGQMAERIAMATPIAGDYDRVQERILATANLTYRRLDEQQELYIRTADALRSMGYQTEQALDIQDSFSYLLTSNAASTERGANAIDAYTKSIQSGKVESTSWQSIMAAMPTIVDAIAQSTGKTAAEIRALGITGKLSITDINEGLRQTVELNKEVAAGMSATVADAVTRLTNTWTQYVGEANRANQTTEKIVKAVDLLSENLDTVVNVAITAGEVMAVVWGLRALRALTAYISSLKAATIATQALTAETLKAASAADKLGMAGKLAAAGWVGWEIGTFLRSEFEVVEKAGIALAASLHKSAAMAQGAWEMAKAVFTEDTVADAQARLSKRLAEIDDSYADLFASASRADEAQKKAAVSTRQAADAASNASVIWAGLRRDYQDVAAALEEQAQELQKSVILKNAEAAAAVQMVQAFGTEAQARNAQADAAQVQAEQLRRVAQQRSVELQVLRAEREALLGLGAATLALDPIKQKELADLEQSIALKQADAGAAIAQAEASQVAAAAAAANAEAMADNSSRVNELREAHNHASTALERAVKLHAQGKITTEDLTKAQIAAGRAALLYRDALNDQAQALAAKARAQQADFSLQETGLRLLMEQQRSIVELARARGDERAAIAAQNELRKLEIQLMELQAAAKRAEADAQVKAVAAKRAELIATGQLTEAKKAELDAALKLAQVKQMEADIAQVTANKMRDLANATRESGNAAKDARAGYDSAAEGINKMANAAERLERVNRRVDRNGEELGEGVTQVGSGYRNRDGWSSDAKGNAITMGGDLSTLTGIANFLKQAGLTDDQAKRIALEFSDGKGEIPYFSNPGQIKYGGQGSTMSQALLKAAERVTFNSGQGGAAGVGGGQGGGMSAASVGKTYNIKLDGGKGRRGDFRFSSEDDADQALRAIELASGRS